MWRTPAALISTSRWPVSACTCCAASCTHAQKGVSGRAGVGLEADETRQLPVRRCSCHLPSQAAPGAGARCLQPAAPAAPRTAPAGDMPLSLCAAHKVVVLTKSVMLPARRCTQGTMYFHTSAPRSTRTYPHGSTGHVHRPAPHRVPGICTSWRTYSKPRPLEDP
jgi:hypothetical protein